MKKQSFYTISLLISVIALTIIGCKTNSTYRVKAKQISIDSTLQSLEAIETLIKPYKDSLDAEMNEVLVFSEKAMIKGTPESELGNFVADLSLEIANSIYQPTDGKKIDFCLLNNGGLRTSLPEGAITRGKIFELMPFDNELVVATINKDSLKTLIHYLNNVGGQPISGLKLDFSKTIDEILAQLKFGDTVKVLTTDYLAIGGDKMNFFLNPLKYELTEIKLRDAIIEYCMNEHKKGNKIIGILDNRIIFDKQ